LAVAGCCICPCISANVLSGNGLLKMIKPDEKTEKAIVGLIANPDFAVFVDTLKKTLDQLREDSDVLAETADIFRNQGARNQLVAILKRIEECKKR